MKLFHRLSLVNLITFCFDLDKYAYPIMYQYISFLDLPRKATDEEQIQQFMVCSQGDDQPSKYICLVCSKTYTSRYNIRMHLNMHTGENGRTYHILDFLMIQ